MSKRNYGVLLLSALACVTVAQAQTSSTTGAIHGIVKSKGGGVLGGATVVVRSLETGLSRSMVTKADGEYTLGLLPVGPYEITVTAPGMHTMKDNTLRVVLGKATPANFSLDKAVASAVVEVAVAQDLLDATTVSNTVSIDEKLVESVPLNGRNFTDLVKLTPGAVTDSQNRQVMEGARGIMNNLTIDGASYNSNFYGEERGSTSTPFAFGLDTIKELQVITDPFDPMYGNAAGGVINAVTKTGGNEVEGSSLFQLRPSSLVAMRRAVPYDNSGGIVNSPQARTRDFSQSQYNFNIGGPIIKDKLFYFVGVEAFHYSQSNSPYMGTSGSNSPAALATFLQNFGNMDMGGHTLASENGLAVTQDQKNTAVFARIDWNINENHRFDLRMNSQQFTNQNGSIPQSSSTGISNNGTDHYNDISWVLELNSSLSPNLANEARLQFATERRPRTPNTTGIPQFVISGNGFTAFSAGQIWYEPSNLNEFTKQLIDTVTYSQGAWTAKGGIDFQWFKFQNQFPQYMGGYYSFDSYATANAWATGTAFPAGGLATYKGAVSASNGWIDYSSSLLTGFMSLNYAGLMNNRLNVVGGFRFTRENAATNPTPNPALNGCDSPNSNLAVDPRIAFTYDLMGDGKTLVKGGYGWFSSPNPSLTVSNTMTANGNNIKVYSITQSNPAWFGSNPSTSPLSYGNRVVGGTQLTPLSSAQLLQFASTPVLVGQLWDPNNKLPRAKRVSLGVEHKLSDGFVVGVRLEYADFDHEQYFVNVNLNQLNADGSTNTGTLYNNGYPTTNNAFTNKTRPGQAVIAGRTVNLTGFGDVFLSENGGTGDYKALILTASRHSDTGFGFQSSLSFANQRDMNSNERVTNNGGTGGSVTNNPADPRANLAPGDNDIRFRGVFAGYFPIYWGVKGVAVITYQSGLPYSSTASSDANGDGASTDYAPGYGGRNAQRQPATKTSSFRLTRSFNLAKKIDLETSIDIYNVFNWANWSTDQYQPQKKVNGVLVTNPSYGQLDMPDSATREVQFGVRLRF